jgi:hypothetical protein
MQRKGKMSKPVTVNKSSQSTPYYIRGVDLVDFLLSRNKSIRRINQVDRVEVIENSYISGNCQPKKSTSRSGIIYEKKEYWRHPADRRYFFKLWLMEGTTMGAVAPLGPPGRAADKD